MYAQRTFLKLKPAVFLPASTSSRCVSLLHSTQPVEPLVSVAPPERIVSDVLLMTFVLQINSSPCSLPKLSETEPGTCIALWTIPNSVRSVSPYSRYLSAKDGLYPS